MASSINRVVFSKSLKKCTGPAVETQVNNVVGKKRDTQPAYILVVCAPTFTDKSNECFALLYLTVFYFKRKRSQKTNKSSGFQRKVPRRFHVTKQ